MFFRKNPRNHNTALIFIIVSCCACNAGLDYIRCSR